MPIKESKYIWFNGKFVPWNEAKIHVLTHSLHYGSGVFEGIRCYKTKYGPAIFRLKDHIKRLYASARVYFMNIPYKMEELINACKELVKVNELEECYIRPIVFRGYGEMGLNPLNAKVEVAIACWEWGPYLGKEGIEKGIKAKISSIRRIEPNILPPNVKCTGHYANSILAKVEAIISGFDEAIMLDHRGYVAEGPGENIFVVKDETIYTPPEHASILKGITRDTVITIAKELGYDVIETDITRDFLYLADEVFFTGTAAEITPIRQIDAYEYKAPGPITKKIQKKFYEIVRGEDEKYLDWLDFIYK